MASLLRLLILVLLVWLAWRFVRRWLDGTGTRATPSRRASPGKVARMVRCRYCDLHLPEGEAVHDGRDWYCSEAHRLADHRHRDG